MSSIDEGIMQVWNLLRDAPEFRHRLRFMLISESVILRVYKDQMYEYRQYKDLTVVRDLKPNRGMILESFIKLEIIITELFLIVKIGLFERNLKLEKEIDKMDINKKYKALYDCGLFNQHVYDLLILLFRARNGLAHYWKFEEVEYKNERLGQKFEVFKHDFGVVWSKIIQVYMQQEENKIKSLIKQLEDKT